MTDAERRTLLKGALATSLAASAVGSASASTTAKSPTTVTNAIELQIPTSAKVMADAIEQMGRELITAAERLRQKQPGETIQVPLTFQLACNGSDGGG